jgi:hypothetical protein
MSLFSAGAKDALFAKHSSNGTALAIIQIPEVPALSPGHTKLSHDVLGTAPTPINQLASGANACKISPRGMSNFILDLYAAGIVSFKDYKSLSEHSELNPHFDKTIGALTNRKAQPE